MSHAPHDNGAYVKSMRESSRYPYTYAADLLRCTLRDQGFQLLSRAEASRIRHIIADALDLDDENVATTLAEAFIEREVHAR